MSQNGKWSLAFAVTFVTTREYTVSFDGVVYAHVLAELGLAGGPDYWTVRYRDTRVMPYDTLADAVAAAVGRQAADMMRVTPRNPPVSATTHEYAASEHSPHCPHCIVAAAERS